VGPSTTEALNEAPTSPARPAAAPLWRRAIARLLDVLTVFFLLWGMVVLHVVWFLGDLSARFAPEPWGQLFVATIMFTILHGIYEVSFLTRNGGQTPGKELCRVRVVRLDDEERPLSLRQAVLRWAIPGGLWLVPPAWLALCLVAATGATTATGAHRALQDFAAGTRVVHFDRKAEDDDTIPMRRAPRHWRELAPIGVRDRSLTPEDQRP
jgi:uncharacterized RDD family membrane protein YckC